jgi:hypothetical protein
LSDLVLERGHPDRSLSSVVLIPPYAFHRGRFITPGAQPLVEVPEVLVEVLPIFLCGHSIYSRRCVFARAVKGFFEELDIDQVSQRREHPLWIADCLLCNPLKFR